MQAELNKPAADNGSVESGASGEKKPDGKTNTNQKHHPLLLQVHNLLAAYLAFFSIFFPSFFRFLFGLLIYEVLLLTKLKLPCSLT